MGMSSEVFVSNERWIGQGFFVCLFKELIKTSLYAALGDWDVNDCIHFPVCLG